MLARCELRRQSLALWNWGSKLACHALARGVIVIGGVSWIGDRLFEWLRHETPRRTINQFACDTPIVPAALGADVGVIGGGAPLL